jgi:hypothetical protein
MKKRRLRRLERHRHSEPNVDLYCEADWRCALEIHESTREAQEVYGITGWGHTRHLLLKGLLAVQLRDFDRSGEAQAQGLFKILPPPEFLQRPMPRYYTFRS